MSAAPSPAPRAARGAAFAVLAILVVTVDTRSYGLIPDGKEMLSAAAAVARFFEIGVSRDFVNAPHRPTGDAVSRYGMGLSLAEAVPGDGDACPSRGGGFGSLGARVRSAADRVPRRRRLGDGALHDSPPRDAALGRGLGSGSRPRHAPLGLRGERLRRAAPGALRLARRPRRRRAARGFRVAALADRPRSRRGLRDSRRRPCSYSRWRRFSRARCSEEEKRKIS